MLAKLFRRTNLAHAHEGLKPFVAYRQTEGGYGYYLCTGCNAIGFREPDQVLHYDTCPHYPSAGNIDMIERYMALANPKPK